MLVSGCLKADNCYKILGEPCFAEMTFTGRWSAVLPSSEQEKYTYAYALHVVPGTQVAAY